MRIQIAVVTHMNYPVYGDVMYLPVMAGSVHMSEEETAGYIRDDSGDNISDKNSRYCELTALYWMWKHSEADSIGICHYRRYLRHIGDDSILEHAEAEALLKQYPVVLPIARKYYIETNYSHFAHSHGALALDMVREVIEDRHPEYIESYDRRMAMRQGHRFNMFMMRRELLNEYCTWLFDILFELERRLGELGSSNEHGASQTIHETGSPTADENRLAAALDDSRLYGHVSERLLDVWLDYTGYRYAELPYVFTEDEHLARKAVAMVMRKLLFAVRRRPGEDRTPIYRDV